MGRRTLGISIAVCLSIFAARASQLPLTAKDVGLMVRMGYSSGVMVQELSTRHFVDTLDSTKEADLIKAGVTPELLTALKNGTYSVPPEEIARARGQIAAEAKRRALEAEQSRKFNTLYQYQLAKERSVAQVQAAGGSGIYSFVKGDLVRLMALSSMRMTRRSRTRN
jgi:hypothetical protein